MFHMTLHCNILYEVCPLHCIYLNIWFNHCSDFAMLDTNAINYILIRHFHDLITFDWTFFCVISKFETDLLDIYVGILEMNWSEIHDISLWQDAVYAYGRQSYDECLFAMLSVCVCLVWLYIWYETSYSLTHSLLMLKYLLWLLSIPLVGMTAVISSIPPALIWQTVDPGEIDSGIDLQDGRRPVERFPTITDWFVFIVWWLH